MNGPLPPLPDAQLAGVFRDAGFWGENLITIIAVALAESGGDPDNVGDEALADAKWGPSIGLAQIRSLRADAGTGRPRDAGRLTDPAFNAAAAFEISGGGANFGPWTQWVNGKWLAFVDRARAAVQAAGDAPAGGPQGLTGSLGGGDGLVDKIVAPLVEGAGRITLVAVLIAGGVALIAAGAWRSTSGVRAAAEQRVNEAAEAIL